MIGKDIRKFIRIGESLAITIPPEFLRNNHVKEGDLAELYFDEKEIRLRVLNVEEIKKEWRK